MEGLSANLIEIDFTWISSETLLDMDNDTLVDYTDDFETLRESVSSNWSIFTSIDFEVSDLYC